VFSMNNVPLQYLCNTVLHCNASHEILFSGDLASSPNASRAPRIRGSRHAAAAAAATLRSSASAQVAGSGARTLVTSPPSSPRAPRGNRPCDLYYSPHPLQPSDRILFDEMPRRAVLTVPVFLHAGRNNAAQLPAGPETPQVSCSPSVVICLCLSVPLNPQFLDVLLCVYVGMADGWGSRRRTPTSSSRWARPCSAPTRSSASPGSGTRRPLSAGGRSSPARRYG
jgi:hypothetical protein